MTRTFRCAVLGVAAIGVLAGCERHVAPVPPAPAAADASKFSPFVVPQATSPAVGNCSLDAVNGAPAPGVLVATGQPVTFSGWMGDADGQVPLVALLVLSGPAKSYSAPITAGGAREDVAKALGKPGLATSGYDLVATTDGVVPGTYALSIRMGTDGAGFCDLNHRITINP